MSRKWLVPALAGLFCFSPLPRLHAAAPQPKGLTMIVMPARYSVLQVGFDVLRTRKAVLVSYQGEAASPEPLLHAWNGSEWVHVPLESYASASFLHVQPARVILIGDEALLPTVLAESSTWCPNVMTISTVDTATLVNSLGGLMRFRRHEWAWFAGRYNLDVSDLNAERRRESWYDRPYVPSSRPAARRQSTYEVMEEAEVIMPSRIAAPAMETVEPAPALTIEVIEPDPAPMETDTEVDWTSPSSQAPVEATEQEAALSTPESAPVEEEEAEEGGASDWRRYIRDEEPAATEAVDADVLPALRTGVDAAASR